MVSDLQGVGHVLTDPAIHTLDPERFKLAVTNLGKEGFKFFFATHVCNGVCRKLGLKSNASMIALSRAQKDIAERGAAPVPIDLRSTAYPAAAARLGHGKGYLYPHDYPNGYVDQEYVPESAKSGPYYEPTDHGFEVEIRKRMKDEG